MTKLFPTGFRPPISQHEMSEEDRATYRKWARFSQVCGLLLVAGLLAVGLSAHHSDPRTAMRGQTVGIDTIAKRAGQPHPGG